MRCIALAVLAVFAASPAFAAGHGHTASKPASEANPRAKTNDGEKEFREKKSHYEKKLQATERESDQVHGTKMKGLTHAPFEAGDVAETGKEARKVDLRESAPPKLKGGDAPAIPPPSLRSGSSGSANGGAAQGGGH